VPADEAHVVGAHDDADLELGEAFEMSAHGQQRAEQSGTDEQRADAEQQRGDGADLRQHRSRSLVIREAPV
jgi:hypothetical protein